MKKILITGIDGLIGGAAAVRLEDAGHQVVGVSRGHRSGGSRRIYQCDIRDRTGLVRIFMQEKPHVCIHAAGCAFEDNRPGLAKEMFDINVSGAVNCAAAAAEAGTETFIFFSSAKVYGEATGYLGCDEDTLALPASFYAHTKLEAELQLKEIADNELLMDLIILRPVPVLGSGDMKGNFPRLIKGVQRKIVPLVDGGRNRKSIAYLPRIAERLAMIVERNGSGSGTYVISDGAFEMAEILRAIRLSRGFAWFVPVPQRLASSAVNAVSLGGLMKRNSRRLRGFFTGFTGNFVVRPHRFDRDFQPLGSFDLRSAFAEVCGHQTKKAA